jgi:hypothetical protein
MTRDGTRDWDRNSRPCAADLHILHSGEETRYSIVWVRTKNLYIYKQHHIYSSELSICDHFTYWY